MKRPRRKKKTAMGWRTETEKEEKRAEKQEGGREDK